MEEVKLEDVKKTGRVAEVKSSGGVMVAIPSVDKKLFIVCAQSLMNAMQVLLLNKMEFEFIFEAGWPYVSMARNNLVSRFMRSKMDQLVFIDSDVGIAPRDFMALVEAPEDVVSGVYPKKNDREEYAVLLALGEGRTPIQVEGAFEAEGAPTGSMKIRRHVIEKMIEKYDGTHGYHDSLDNLRKHNFFGTFVDKGRWYGDDYGFCKLWRDIGGRVFVLPNMTFIHVGTKNYEGNLFEFMMGQAESPVKESLLIDGWMSMKELEWLYMMSKGMKSVAEIGAFKGRATSTLAKGCSGKVYAIDHWLGDDDGNLVLRGIYEKEKVYDMFIKNMEPYPNVEAMKMSSVEAAGKIDGTIDMVFIDGEHTYESVKADIEAWLPKTRKLIAGHDYSKEWPGVMQAVKESFGRVNVVDTIWWVDMGGQS